MPKRQQPPTEPIAFRASPELKQLIEAAAAFEELTPSSWLQQVLAELLENYVKEHGDDMLRHLEDEQVRRAQANAAVSGLVRAAMAQPIVAGNNKP